MRTLALVIATALLGSLTGLGLTYYEAATVEDRFDPNYVNATPATKVDEAMTTGRAVVLGESVFDFGTLEQEKSGTCSFKLRNESVVPLVIDLEGVSCGLCIDTDLTYTEMAPGEEYEFLVSYTTHKPGPEFSEYVEVRTSDPKQAVIRFNVTGYVTRLVGLSKSEIDLGSISAGEDASAEFRIYGYAEAPLEIVSHEFSSQRAGDYCTLELSPLEPADFQEDEPRAKSAILARLTVEKGKPLGPIDQTLHLFTRMGSHETEAEISIRAKIVSDITLIGGGDFIKDQSVVRMRTVLSETGYTTTLRVRVRGPYRDNVKLSVGAIDPAQALTASLGEPTVLNNGYLYPLTISVPKGAPPVNRLGSLQGKVGSITIETTHPSAKQVPIYVSFAVE